MDDNERFFKMYSDMHVQLRYFDQTETISVKELYNQFKIRMMKELGLSEKGEK